MLQDLIQRIDLVLGDASRPVPLHVPNFGGNCSAYVQECVETGWVSSVGGYVTRFEEDMADYTGAKHAVAVGTGTAGLHIALLMAGVEPGDQVLCPSLTFVATANAVRYCNATPHFVEVEPVSLGVDAAALDAYLADTAERRGGVCIHKKTGARIRALVGMHAYGHPFDIAAVAELCEKWGLVFVEDAAESLGSLYHGRHTGTFGLVGVLSFNGNKTLTTGGGGMVLTNDTALAEWAKHVTTTAKRPHRWEYFHDEVGYNYRLPNLNAALGCGQLETIEETVAAKRALADRYRAAFASSAHAAMLPEPASTRSNYWLNVLVLDEALADRRDELLDALCDAGVMVRPIWMPMHELPMYADCPRMPLGVTESFARRVICLPSTAGL